MRTPRLRTLALAAPLLFGLTARGGGGSGDGQDDGVAGAKGSGPFPVTVEHALGTTVNPGKPERVATGNRADDEVPLALGVVPVGMAKANFGDGDGDGVLPVGRHHSTAVGVRAARHGSGS
ncbi:iron complex transport system substrate-binding protein [Streptomyces sp. di188]|nr:iron complex transport system substrate-binding protein [Streptomyces sp. di188]SCE00672.1 iron complex transport system substrate-binding protein [Streptomyces sp. di50b]